MTEATGISSLGYNIGNHSYTIVFDFTEKRICFRKDGAEYKTFN